MAELHDTLQSIHRSLDFLIKFFNIPNPNPKNTDASIGFLDSKSKNEESITPISDFRVVESEEAIPIPMGINEEEDDSLELELIPPFFFVDNEEVDSLEDLLPSYFFEEDVDSIEFDLIPHFFFVENEGVDSLDVVRVQFEEIAKSDTNVFSKLIQHKIDGVKEFEMPICFEFFEEFCKNPEYLNELFFHDNKLLSLDCIFLHPYDTRCLFDRGKYDVLSPFTSEKNLEKLILSFGFDSDLWFINLFAVLCGNNAEIRDARKVFVEISKKHKNLLLIMSTVAQECSAFTRRYPCRSLNSFTLCGNTFVSCLRIFNWLILMDVYKEKSVFLSIASWRYLSELSSLCLRVHVYVNDIEVGNGIMLLVTMYEQDNIVLVRIFPIELVSQLVIHMVQMWSEEFSILQPWRGMCHAIAVYSLGLLVFLHIRLGSFACIYAFILSTTVIILHYEFLYLQPQVFYYVALWFHKFQGTWFDQIARICALVRQVTAQLIQFDSPAGDLSYKHLILVLWLSMDQRTWFNKLAGTSVSVRHVLSQMIYIVSPAGVFPCEQLIFLLIPSLGYHSVFSYIQFIVLICITDADIFEERKLSIPMAVRIGIHLVENVVERLTCSDAQTFILAEWLEVSASEHEHMQWLPKTMYVYESIYLISFGYLLPSFSYFWGSTSHAKVDYPRARCFIHSLRTQAMCIVFHFQFMWMLVDLFSGKSTVCSFSFWTVRTITWVDLDFASDVYLASNWFLRATTLQETKASQHITAAYERFLIREGVAHYLEKHYNTRYQSFDVIYSSMLLTEFPSYTIDFTKVYFFISILLIPSICASLPTAGYIRTIFDRGKAFECVESGPVFDRNISRFYFTCYFLARNGLNFTDPCDGKSAHGRMLKIGYHLVLLFRFINVFGFVLNGEKCVVGQLVNEIPRQDCILWSIVIVQMARKEDGGSAPTRYGQSFLQVTNLGITEILPVWTSNGCIFHLLHESLWLQLYLQVPLLRRRHVLEVGSTLVMFGQLLLRVNCLAHLTTVYKHNPFSGFHTAFDTIPLLLLPLLPQMTLQCSQIPAKSFTPCHFQVSRSEVEKLHQLVSPKSNADMNGSMGMSTYPARGVADYGAAVYHGPHNTTKFGSMKDFTEPNPSLWSFFLAVCFADNTAVFS